MIISNMIQKNIYIYIRGIHHPHKPWECIFQKLFACIQTATRRLVLWMYSLIVRALVTQTHHLPLSIQLNARPDT